MTRETTMTARVQLMVPVFVNKQLDGLAKKYGVKKNLIIRYLFWNAKNIFEKGCKDDPEQVRDLLDYAYNEMVIEQTRLAKGKLKKLPKMIREMEK
ncbi:MAG: hypothetical protein A2001_11120 [Treponema sp. GWC1_61_84]|nr:MAG: hypothetical protein A2001_11120 [Treponema sp. GWC1_61_84]